VQHGESGRFKLLVIVIGTFFLVLVCLMSGADLFKLPHGDA